MLVSGDLGGLVPAVLVPLVLAAFVAGFEAASRRLPDGHVSELIRDVSEVLGTAPADTGAAGCA